jgi:hypothetical protein
MLYDSGMLLLTTVAGYWVLERAEAHKGELKRVGRIVGIAVMLLSLLGIVCQVYSNCGAMKGYCPVGMGKMKQLHHRMPPPN